MISTDQRKARPERIRVRLSDDARPGAIPIELPTRAMWPFGLFIGATFAIFAAIEWLVILQMSKHSVNDVFDLMFLLFEGFWALGWSVAVVSLGALAVLLFFYGESARIQDGKLVHVPRLGPLKILVDYDLARVRNLRLENAGSEESVRIRFDYGDGTNGLGDTMPRATGQRILDTMKSAAAGVVAAPVEHTAPARALEVPRAQPQPPREPFSIFSLSSLALIAANLMPLAGVLLFGWDLASVMVLFWAESGAIAFYTVLKMIVVGKLAAVLSVPFFIGHFGGFMAGHFLLIYSFFIGRMLPGPQPGAGQSLRQIFIPLLTSIAGLFISHGISFVTNFIGRREYTVATMKDLMTAPYNRIVVMQLALIFGGWIIILTKSPVGALVLLIVLKTAFDLSAHRKERQRFGTPA